MVRYGNVLRVLAIGCLALALSTFALAQTPAGADAPRQRLHADMLQLMRGVLYPASNVIFTAQSDDPESFEPAVRTSTSPNPFTAVYGKWMAVELSGLALAESANLLTIPGRLCGNGRPAPVQNADWQLWVEELREAGMVAYKAAQTKSQDEILIAAGTVAESCSNCHRKYRNVPGGFENRCMAESN